ncbi:MAG: hypothetical protein CMH27_06760 [Micavibrio sp.]|nr:hypothetical protein [Micavibrio sp.]
MKFFTIITCLLSLLMLGVGGFSAPVKAQGANNILVPDFEHFYDDVTLEKLSKLYWRLNKFDISDNQSIDDFLRINECDIYTQYIFNEFEWQGVRKKAREYITQNVETFPDRFKFEQPLRLKDYNARTQMFEILPEYQIDGIRKFEVYAKDIDERVCLASGNRGVKQIENYPKVLLVELNQPVNLTQIPVQPAVAKRYIDEKMQEFLKIRESRRSREVMYSLRDAYIVMKFRAFSYKGTDIIMNGLERDNIYAMLEGYEIYADPNHEVLLYFENYIRKSQEKPLDVRLKEQFEALKKKRNQD